MNKEQLQQVRDALLNIKSYGDVYRYKAHEVNPYVQLLESLATIDAELAKPEQEPVAWQERQAIGERDGVYRWSDWYSCKYNTEQVVKARLTSTLYEWRPLYTAPVA